MVHFSSFNENQPMVKRYVCPLWQNAYMSATQFSTADLRQHGGSFLLTHVAPVAQAFWACAKLP